MFDEQYIHADELPQLAWGLNDKRRVHDAAAFAFTGMPGSKFHADLDRAMAVWDYCAQNYVPVDFRCVDWKLVNHGDVIDLGGKKLECIYMNAHGSMIYYNREEDYALCGDNLTYTLALGDIDEDVVAKFKALEAKLTDHTMLYSGHLYYEDIVTRPREIDVPMLRQLIAVMESIASGKYPEGDMPEVRYEVEGAPTLKGYTPDPDDAASWEAFHAQHPERKGKSPKEGTAFLHMVGPILVTYKK